MTKQYYAEILRYCYKKLPNDPHGAEDCTQEVFFLLYQKAEEINFQPNIRGWLYASADRIINNYQKKQSRILQMLNVDMDQIEDPANNPEQLFTSQMLAVLPDDELDLLKAYYGANKNERREIAKKYNLTLAQLYKKIHSIRDKIRAHYKK